MHLRPADFFTRNPALDVPSKRNGASVLVPCCGKSGGAGNATDEKATVQDSPVTHLQGADDVQAKDFGAEAEAKQEDDKSGRRLSKVLSGLMKFKSKD